MFCFHLRVRFHYQSFYHYILSTLFSIFHFKFSFNFLKRCLFILSTYNLFSMASFHCQLFSFHAPNSASSLSSLVSSHSFSTFVYFQVAKYVFLYVFISPLYICSSFSLLYCVLWLNCNIFPYYRQLYLLLCKRQFSPLFVTFWR